LTETDAIVEKLGRIVVLSAKTDAIVNNPNDSSFYLDMIGNRAN